MSDWITVRGVRTHNLKNIDIDIAREKITALVGVCGAGKTSLAFNTIYAEGYSRYIESISPYIRQFLDKIEKPPLDSIDGLPPAIAVRQKKKVKNPRSIVATSLDVYDYLRLLYSKTAKFHCPGCGSSIRRYSIDEMTPEIFDLYQGKIEVCFPYKGEVAFLINRGYYFYVDPEKKDRQRIDAGVKQKDIYVLIDTIELEEQNTSRVFEALDRSIALGSGDAVVFYIDQKDGKKQSRLFPSGLYCPHCDIRYPEPDEHLFSFNSPKGACQTCKGFGDLQDLDKDLLFDTGKSLAEGAVHPFNTPATRYFRREILENAQNRGIDINKPLASLSEEDLDFLMNGSGYFGGIRGYFDRLRSKSYKVQSRVFISRYSSYTKCPDCDGARLNALARAFTIQGKNLPALLNLTIGKAAGFIHSLEPADMKHAIDPAVIGDIYSRLHFLVETGLSYIQLDRPTFTLSRGEFQRINLTFILGSTLTDSLLIMDQPSSDLHPRDYEKIVSYLQQLKQFGNTILLIEHNRDIAAACDRIIELGPYSGENGGSVVFSGNTSDFFRTEERDNKTVSQSYFSRTLELKPGKPTFSGWLTFKDACTHNLKGFDIKIPKHAFTVVTGVSGSGKTTLLYHEMYLKPDDRLKRGKGRKQVKETIFVDPGLQRVRANSIVAGFFGVFSPLREFFASLKESKIHQLTPGHFSFNSAQGRCEVCKGKGFKQVEMQFLPAVDIPCNTCNGSGYKADVLKIMYKEKNIRQVLDLSINAFVSFAGERLPMSVQQTVAELLEHGLGHIRLGQPLITLSAGELQRLKLLKHLNLNSRHNLFLIDEPSYGMHPCDLEMVMGLIDKLTANQNTVVAAEHNMELISQADYIVELGPGAGEEGGNIIFAGLPQDLLHRENSPTAGYLKKNIKNT